MTTNPSPGFPSQTGFPTGPAPAVAASAPNEGPGKEKKKRARSAGSKRRFGAIAIVLAVAAGVLMLTVLGNATSPDNTYVLRAARVMSVISEVTPGDIEAIAVSSDAVEPGAIKGSTPEEVLDFAIGEKDGPDGANWKVVGQRPRTQILEGQQLRPEMFTSGQGSIVAVLGEDERLVSVQVPVSKALAGALAPGDYVDVAVSSSDITGVVAEGAEIVAVAVAEDIFRSATQRQSANDLGPREVLPSDPIPGTYVLRVPADRAVPIINADSAGTLYLIARPEGPGEDIRPTPNAATDLFSAVCSAPSARNTQKCSGFTP